MNHPEGLKNVLEVDARCQALFQLRRGLRSVGFVRGEGFEHARRPFGEDQIREWGGGSGVGLISTTVAPAVLAT
jgi:hypothetical protein